jgi:hypothetical protein
MSLDKIVDLGAFRAKLRVGTKYGHPKTCDHLVVTIDADGGTLECDECKKSLSAFTVLVSLCRRWDDIADKVAQLKRRAAAMRQMLSKYKVRQRALKEFEKHWWRGNLLPCCPHCGRGLMAEDFADGAASGVGREYEMAVRKRAAQAGVTRQGGDASIAAPGAEGE